MSLKIITKEVSALKKNPSNAREHSPMQIEQVKNSIKEFGFTNPILIDKYDYIIAGHCRYEAASLLNLKTVPCLVLSLSDKQKKGYALADNQLSLNSHWNFDLLKNEIIELNNLNFNLDLIGFDEATLDDLLAKDNNDLPTVEVSEKGTDKKLSFTVTEEQASIIEKALLKAKNSNKIAPELDENIDSYALALVCENWLKIARKG